MIVAHAAHDLALWSPAIVALVVVAILTWVGSRRSRL
jgi:hypothetical protein